MIKIIFCSRCNHDRVRISGNIFACIIPEYITFTKY